MRRAGILAIIMVAATMFIPGTAGAAGRTNFGQVTLTGTCQSASNTNTNVGVFATKVERVVTPVTPTMSRPRPYRTFKRVTALAVVHLTPNTTYQLYIVSNYLNASGVVTGCAATTDASAVFSTDASGVGGAVFLTDLDPTRQNLSIAICQFDPTGLVNCIGQPSGWSSPLQRI